uniref:Reverse transcriptase domain-containing protein n=1 Tax=Xenopus tropicalis TaxID=8364 RepID=A0A803J4Y6_XENTR
MATTKVMSWNVRGLGSAIKRRLVLDFIRRNKPQIIMLQETHLVGSKFLALKRPWIGSMHHSLYSSYSRGVSILICKTCPFVVETVISDRNGKYVVVHGTLQGKKLTLANIYIPPPFAEEPLREVMNKILTLPMAPLLLMGDFNAVMDATLDKLNPPRISTPAFNRWISGFQLTDLWRVRNPGARQYTCYSPGSNNMSRIDLALGCEEMNKRTQKVEILTRGISDHSPITISILTSPTLADRIWRLSPYWATHAQLNETIHNSIETFTETNREEVPPDVTWDAFKAYIRGVFISNIKAIETNLRAEILLKTQRVQETEAKYIAHPNMQNQQEWQDTQRALTLAQIELTKKHMLYQKAGVFEQGDKNGKLLALLSRDSSTTMLIPAVKLSNGTITSSPEEVNTRFAEFYTDLYTSKLQVSSNEIQDYLKDTEIPKLDLQTSHYLDTDITITEIEMAIGASPSGKTPGTDGIPMEWYKQHTKLIAPLLMKLYNGVKEGKPLPNSMKETLIVLILKPGKDPLECSSYRPISLINADAKILAKVLATRIAQHLSKVISPDQTGFMPGRMTDTNIRRLFTNITITHDNPGTRLVATLDNMKAFDSVEWEYLWATMKRVGIHPTYINWVKALYHLPTAKVRTNTKISAPLAISRGTRQGCPLSPLLFALAMEPMACRIKTQKDIEGLKLGPNKEIISMYADDTLIYLPNPDQALTLVLNTINTHTNYSGLKINWDKSVLFPIDPRPQQAPNQTHGLQWVESFKYLGIWVHANLNKFVELNIHPILKLIEAKIEIWANLPLTLIGRINLFKMVILPKLMYIFRQAPTLISGSTFAKLKSLVTTLYWNRSPPRIALTTLQLPTSQGGLAAPNLHLYYLAAQLTVARNWTVPTLTNAATILEAQVMGSLEELKNLLYRGTKYTKKASPLMKATIRAWQATNRLHPKPQKHYSEHTPLWCNPHLKHFKSIPDPQLWAQHNIKYLSDIMENGILLPYPELKQKHTLPNRMLFRYLQLRHAAETQFGHLPIETTPTHIETMIYSETLKKPLSSFYAQLIQVGSVSLNRLYTKWQADIPHLTQEHWVDILDSAFEGTISSKDKMTQLNYLHRTYLTPHRLHGMNANISQNCPRCQYTPANFIHMVWECPIIKTYWREVIQQIKEKTDIALPMDPITILLNQLGEITPRRAQNTLLSILCMYAKKAIAIHWKSRGGPSPHSWEQLIEKAIPLYKLTYMRRSCPDKFYKVWEPWIEVDPITD